MTRKKPLPPAKMKTEVARAPRPGPSEWEQLKTKLGWSMIAVCVGLFGLQYLMPHIKDDSNDKQGLYASVAVFWVFLLYGITKAFVWTPSQQPAGQAAGAEAEAVVAAGGAPDAGDSTAEAAKGGSRRSRRA